MRRPRWIALVVLAAFSLGGLAACGSDDDTTPQQTGSTSSPGSTTGDTGDTEPVPDLGELAVAYAGRAMNYAPTFVAEEQGFFAARGLTIKNLDLDGPSTIPTLLESGEADVSLSSSPSQLAAMSRGLRARLIATAGDALGPLTIITRPGEFPTVEDLEGHTFGTTSIGSGGHYALSKLFEHYGWVVDQDVFLAPVGGLDSLIAALETKAIDAFVWTIEVAAALEERGEAVTLGTVADYLGDEPLLVQTIIASQSSIEGKPEAISAYLAAFFEAVQWTIDNPDAWQTWAVGFFDITPGAAKASYDAFLDIWNPTGEPSAAELGAAAAAIVFTDEDTETPPDASVFYDGRFVPVDLG